MAPPRPEMPEQSPPRAINPPLSVNQQRTPRTGWEVNLTSFQILRAMADEPLFQIGLKDVRGQILGMKRDIVPEEGVEESPALTKEIARVKAAVDMPDPLQRMNLRSLISRMVDEVHTTDALTLYPHYARGGKFLALEWVDGATIVPLVDARGRHPLPPSMGGATGPDAYAFEQALNGRVETSFYLDELWYRPMNPRTDTPYGRPSAEVVLLILNIALRRQMRDLEWFTEGQLPEGFYTLPDEWTPDQVLGYEENFYAKLETPNAGFRPVKFVPPGTYQELKSRVWSLDELEWYARQICGSLGISPIPYVKMMNRGTGDTLETSTLESGVRPLAQHIADILTEFVKGPLASPELRFAFPDDETEDATTVYQRNVAYFGRGGLTLNEFLEQTGSAPLDSDMGEERMIETPSGPVFLSDLVEQRERAKKAKEDRIDPTLIQRAFLEVPIMTRDELRASVGLPPMGGEAGAELITIAQAGSAVTQPGTSPGRAPAAAAPDPKKDEPNETPAGEGSAEAGAEPLTEKSAAHDLSRWQAFTLKRVKEGRPLRRFETQAITPRVKAIVELGLRRAGRNAERVRRVFTLAPLGKIEQELPASAGQAAARIEQLVADWLEANRDRIVGDAVAAADLPEPGAEKAAGLRKDDDETARRLNAIPLDMTDLIPDLTEALAEAASAGAADTATLVGYDLDRTPESALDFAQRRAAELVGMRRLADGSLVTNPNPEFAITESLRESIRLKVAAAIEQGLSPQELTTSLSEAFDRPRAETIARTETGFAYNDGTAAVYEEAGQEHVEILDGDGCLPKGHDDTAPRPSGAVGVVEEQAQANGQVWTVAQFRQYPLGHPNCVRAGVPYQATQAQAA